MKPWALPESDCHSDKYLSSLGKIIFSSTLTSSYLEGTPVTKDIFTREKQQTEVY